MEPKVIQAKFVQHGAPIWSDADNCYYIQWSASIIFAPYGMNIKVSFGDNGCYNVSDNREEAIKRAVGEIYYKMDYCCFWHGALHIDVYNAINAAAIWRTNNKN